MGNVHLTCNSFTVFQCSSFLAIVHSWSQRLNHFGEQRTLVLLDLHSQSHIIGFWVLSADPAYSFSAHCTRLKRTNAPFGLSAAASESLLRCQLVCGIKT